MPEFEITAPDGAKYQVTAPEGATEQDALARVQAEVGAAPQGDTAPSLGGAARAVGGGLQSAATSMGGMGGDIRETLARLVNRGSSAVGYEIPQHVASDVLRVAGGPLMLGPTSEVTGKTAEHFFGPDYQPQNTLERVIKTGFELAPGMIGGPEGLAVKALTRVGAPAVASVAAGEGGAGPLGQAGAAVAGSIAAHRMVTPRIPVAPIPTPDELRTAARAGYRSPEVEAVRIQPASVNTAANDIDTALARSGFHQTSGDVPQVFRSVERLRTDPGARQTPILISEIESVRKQLGNYAREVDTIGRPTPNAAAATQAIDVLNNYVTNLRQPNLVAGNAQRANEILREAAANWGAMKRGEDIGVRLTRAERQAAKSGSGTNIDNALRQKVSAVLDVPKRSVGYNPAELAQAETTVRGDMLTNALRKVGKLGFGDGLSLLMHTGAAIGTGGATIPIGIAGTVARMMAQHRTQNAAQTLEHMLLSRSPEARAFAAHQARLNARNPRGLNAPQTGAIPGALSFGGGGGLLGLLPVR